MNANDDEKKKRKIMFEFFQSHFDMLKCYENKKKTKKKKKSTWSVLIKAPN